MALLGGVAALALAGCGTAPRTGAAGPVSPAGGAGAAVSTPSSQTGQPLSQQVRFAAWLEDMKAEARQAGIRADIVEGVLGRARLDASVLDLDRRQPEFTRTLGGYFAAAVPESRVQDARRQLAAHRATLSRLEDQYRVPAEVLVAFWGLETNFGRTLGSHSVIDALASLAFEGRREAFFKAQLLDALRILEAGHIRPEAMVGSWAGAMGHTQFMPSTFRAHARDGDGDGRIDPWRSVEDALASGANYLNSLGWDATRPWGWEVRLPQGFDYGLSGLDTRRSLDGWAAQGVTLATGAALPVALGGSAALLLPAGHEGPAFLVTDNFDVILGWNRSILYALAVGHLSDRVAGAPPLVRPPPTDDPPLRTREVEEIQRRLTALGFDAGPADGLIGARTRSAIRAFQSDRNQPADGHADASLLRTLRAVGG